MITILHGDHQVQSRNRLVSIKSESRAQNKEIITLDGSSLELTDLIQSVESQSLFNDDRLVIVENLLSSLKIGKKRDEFIDYLLSAHFDTNLILWEAKSVGKQIIKLKRSKQVTVESFKMPTVIFKFVDGLGSQSPENSITDFRSCLKNNVIAEIIFTMIVRQFRILIALDLQADITETVRLAPWQKSKLIKQSSLFSRIKLQSLYKKLLIIDFQIKTGKSPIDLTKRLEQFIIDL